MLRYLKLAEICWKKGRERETVTDGNREKKNNWTLVGFHILHLVRYSNISPARVSNLRWRWSKSVDTKLEIIILAPHGATSLQKWNTMSINIWQRHVKCSGQVWSIVDVLRSGEQRMQHRHSTSNRNRFKNYTITILSYTREFLFLF
jgi:hypothetical protein